MIEPTTSITVGENKEDSDNNGGIAISDNNGDIGVLTGVDERITPNHRNKDAPNSNIRSIMSIEDGHRQTFLLEEANNAYLTLVSTFNDEVMNASNLLDESNETSRIYRGLLLGWTCDDGATVKELLTGRLQHDVGYSSVHFQLDDYSVKKSPLPK